MASSIISGSLGGYSTEFLLAEQQERFTFVKTKLCGNKAVDVADLEKNGMISVVAAIRRMQWMGITTFSEVSYPDLVKAFYVCLRTEADGSLISSVKGTQIMIDHEVLKTLFDVSTSGHSGIHSVDSQAKGLGIVVSEFRLKDGKLDINQLNAFNLLLHFVVYQILVPRSATFSTCTKADSDMMFWAIQNQEINMAETKTSVAEGEPILGEAQEVQLEAVAAESEGPSAVAEPAAREAAAPSASLEVAAHTEVAMETPVAEENVAVADSVRRSEDHLPTSSVASVLRQVLDAIHSSPVVQNTGGSLIDQSVAPDHIQDLVLIDAPIQGEQGRFVEDAPIQGEQGRFVEDAPIQGEHFEVPIEVEEQVEKGSPSKKTAHKRQNNFLKKMHLKPILKRLDDQVAVLDSVRSAVSSIFERQASLSNENFQTNVAMKWFNKELGSMKMMLSEVLKAVGPKDPTPQEREPSEPSEDNAEPSRQISVDLVELPSGRPSGPSVEVQPSEKLPTEDSILCQGSGPEKESLNPVEPVADSANQAVAPEPPASSSLPTPVAPSPPSSSTAPPAPTTFKRPRPRSISSPQPFPSQLASSPISSTIVPSPPSSPQIPPASSSVGPSSSSGPSSSGPSALPTITPASIFNPPTPPSFITIIPEGAQLTQIEIQDIKDEFEVAILRSVLAIGTHSHRTGSSSPVSKKRRLTSSHPVSSEPCYPPLWFSLSISNKQKLIYEEYLQKKEIKFIRQYQMYSNYYYVNRLPESQLGQFRAAIRALSSSTAHTESLQVDFATLVIPDVVFLPPLHALIMDSSVGTLIFERAARVMARLFVKDGRDLSFPRFVFRQYLQGHIKVDVLAPILSECERLSPEEWTKLYPLSAQQLGDLNASQASSNQPPLSPSEFLDANSLHHIRDSYLTWVERYKLHIKRMAPTMGPSYQIEIGAFQAFFEEQERQALLVIRRFGSLLSPAHYLSVSPQN
ncbi:hypothetical protein Taro_032099 [Colocasia esculenta]|uniref:Uncharacterized protein n=1 Tax=Colocasia esculenta TaxID=4460 RepID=A0A843VTW1_COLES|nr:hypothetical protein [Colocasia esculenta]